MCEIGKSREKEKEMFRVFASASVPSGCGSDCAKNSD